MGERGGAIRESHAQGPGAPVACFRTGWGCASWAPQVEAEQLHEGALVLTALIKASCAHSKAGLLSST